MWNVFPAHAGMSPYGAPVVLLHWRFPRTRGDEPMPLAVRLTVSAFSPHTRG